MRWSWLFQRRFQRRRAPAGVEDPWPSPAACYTGSTHDSSDKVSNLSWPDRHWLHWLTLTLTHLGLQASSPPPLLSPPPPVHRPLPTYGSLSTQEESNGPNTPASPTRRRPSLWSIRDRELYHVGPATGDQARHPDSTVSDGRDGRDDRPDGHSAVDGSTVQAAPPAGCGHRASEISLKNDAVFGATGFTGPREVDQGNNQGRPRRTLDHAVGTCLWQSPEDTAVVSESESGGEALATATAAPLAPEIADSDVEAPNASKTHKRPYNKFIFDVFAESDDEANTTAVGRQKRSRCGGDIVINDITDNDNIDDEPTRQAHHRPAQRCARPPPPARQTRGAQRPTSRSHAKLVTHSVRQGESSASAWWQVQLILGERQTDAGFMYEVREGKGRATRTIWRYRADIDLEMLKGFKAGQRSRRHEARSAPRG